MLRSAELLAAAGADLLICPDNSAHRAWPFLHDRTPVPFLHIADEVGKEAHRRGLKRIGLLGTRFTMDGPVYPDRFDPIGLDVVVPDADDRDVVDDIIFSELVDGIFTDESRRRYVEIIERLEKKGCDAVALSCTEIPLLIAAHDSPLPTLDSTRLLAAAAVEAACR
jgi:aspartate racemase